MAVTNIPAPDNDVVQTWLKGTRDKKLVYSAKDKKWKIVPANKVTEGDVSYENYQQGEKTIGKESPYTPSRDEAGNIIPPPTAGAARYEAAVNPLKPFIDKYGLYVRTDEGGETYLADKTNKRYYLYYTSDGTLQLDFDYDKVKKAAIDDLKKTGQLNALFDELYKRKAISKSTYDLKSIVADDFNAGLQKLISEYSKSVIASNQPNQDPQKFFDFVRGVIGEAPVDEGTLPRREFQDISKEQLNAFIDSIYLETIGRKPTDEQRSAKFKELNKIVKAGILTTTKKVGGEIQTRQTGGFDERKQTLKLQEQLKSENPLEYERRQAFEFMTELGKIMSGGM